jgi:hypothetical protein
MVEITGNTFPVKDELKALGGRWLPARKAWAVPDDKAEQARQLVADAVASPKRPGGYRPRSCVVCGITPQRNSRGYTDTVIYRSGECRDCFEERKMGY